MDIQLHCSALTREKINRLIDKSELSVTPDADVALVERGFEMPAGILAIVFDTIDYREAIELLMKEVAKHPGTETITGFANNRYSLLPLADIQYIEALGSDILCHVDTCTYYLKNTLQYYDDLFSNRGLIRINKSQVVNMMHVKEIIPWFNSRIVLVLKNNKELEVSKVYAKLLRKKLQF
jgi:DNA-binding LytR/AlgR family response regulator